MKEKYEIVRSNRKSVSIEVTKECKIIVRVPYYLSQEHIDMVIKNKEDWIRNKIKLIKEIMCKKKGENTPKLTDEDILSLKDRAKVIIPEKVHKYAQKIGVSYGDIKIKQQKTCWGSCSSKGNLNFNCLLMLMPNNIIDYVVVHELCHRKEMNHSKKFWREVENILPDYEISRNWLKNNGIYFMQRA